MAKIATVAAVTGNAVVVGLDGTVRALKVGDIIQKGEIVRTAAGARVELIMEDGQTMAVAPEHTVRVDEAVAQTEATPAAQEAAVQSGTVDQILQVLEQGGDLTQELEAAAAGGGAGSGGDGSDFVRLLRVTEGVDPLAYNYNFQPLDGPDEVLLSADAPVPTDEQVVGNVTLRYIELDEEGQPRTTEGGGFVYIDGDKVVEGTPVGLVAEVDVPPTGSNLVLTLSNGQTITIPVGQSNGFVELEIRADEQYVQGEQSIDVSVTGATGGQYDELNIDQSTAIGVVDDSDATTVALSDVTVAEGVGTATVTATVSNPVTGTPLVITLSNGATVTIPVGQSSAASTPFAVQGDDPYKDGESYVVSITGTSGGNYEALNTSDTAKVTVNDTIDTTNATLTSAFEGNEDGATVTYTVTVGTAPTSNETFTFMVGEVQKTIITVQAGQTTGTTTVTFSEPDVFVDSDTIPAPTGLSSTNNSNYEQLNLVNSGTAHVVGDTVDTVTATLTTSTTEISENGGNIVYTVTLSGGPGVIDPDTNLTFKLANGEEVTVLAGQLSGSYTKTYADADITNQPSIANSISSVIAGGAEYENLVTAGTTNVDVDYGVTITGLTPEAQGGDVVVYEDDLSAARGIGEHAGSDSTPESTTQPGTFTIAAGDGVQSLTVGGLAVIVNGVYQGNGIAMTTPLGNTLTITGYEPATGVVSYTYTLNDNEPHATGAGNNSLFENLTVTLTDTDNDIDTGTLSVKIVDDIPVANEATNSGQATQQTNSNVMLILDVSGSMADPSGYQGMTRLEVMIKSSLELLDQYDALGDVRVNIVTFSSYADTSGNLGNWVTVDVAKQLLLSLQDGGRTNYDDALNDAIAAFGSTGKLPGAQNVSYFMSDGEPNDSGVTNPVTLPGGNDLGGGSGIDAAEQADWEAFLVANKIKSYSLGMGDGVTASALEPIGYDGTLSKNIPAIVVTDLSQLTATLVNTVLTTPVTGQLLDGGLPASVGADGGWLQSITVNGVTYSYNQKTDTPSVTGGASQGIFNQATNEWTVATPAGASLKVDMDTGEYVYTPPATIPSNGVIEQFGYTVVDGDGDIAGSTLRLTISPAEGPMVVRDDFVVTNQDPATIPDWALLANDTGPNSAVQTLAGVSSSTGGVTTDNANSTVTFDDDSTLGGSFVYTNAAGTQTDTGTVFVNRVTGNTLNGGFQDDIIIGGAAGETLNGGAGNDILIGGSGTTVAGTASLKITADGARSSTNTDYLHFDFASAPAGVSVTSIVLNLRGGTDNDASFDPTAGNDFGGSGEWGPTLAALSGLTSGNVTVNVPNNSPTMTINFAAGTFTSGDSFDLNIAVESLGANSDGGKFGSTGVTATITLSNGSTQTVTFSAVDADTSEANFSVPVVVVDDTLNGGVGNDILVGGTGNDVLTGGAGADVFKWTLGETGRDTVTDFNKGNGSFSLSEGDVLDLRDLVSSPLGATNADLADYLHFAEDGSGNLVLSVDPNGSQGGFSATQTITLEGVSLSSLSLAGDATHEQVIAALRSNLKLDGDA